jgi:hypothetical protein
MLFLFYSVVCCKLHADTSGSLGFRFYFTLAEGQQEMREALDGLRKRYQLHCFDEPVLFNTGLHVPVCLCVCVGLFTQMFSLDHSLLLSFFLAFFFFFVFFLFVCLLLLSGTDNCCQERHFLLEVLPSLKRTEDVKGVVDDAETRLLTLPKGKEVTLVTTNEQSVEACASLMGSSSDEHFTALGFDIEWCPPSLASDSGCDEAAGVPATVQLCTLSGEAFVWHLPSIGAPPRKNSGDGSADNEDEVPWGLPPSLATLLKSNRFQYVGVGVKGDCTRMTKYFGVAPPNVVDVGTLGLSVGYKRASLDGLLRDTLDFALSKKESVRKSEWNLALRSEQVLYAALDAYAGVCIFAELLEESKRCEVKVGSEVVFCSRQMNAVGHGTAMEVDAKRVKIKMTKCLSALYRVPMLSASTKATFNQKQAVTLSQIWSLQEPVVFWPRNQVQLLMRAVPKSQKQPQPIPSLHGSVSLSGPLKVDMSVPMQVEQGTGTNAQIVVDSEDDSVDLSSESDVDDDTDGGTSSDSSCGDRWGRRKVTSRRRRNKVSSSSSEDEEKKEEAPKRRRHRSPVSPSHSAVAAGSSASVRQEMQTIDREPFDEPGSQGVKQDILHWVRFSCLFFFFFFFFCADEACCVVHR